MNNNQSLAWLRFMALIGCLSMVLCMTACSPAGLGTSKSSDASAMNQASEGSMFLWKVKSQQEQNTVWLLGSIHAGSADMYPLSQEMEKAYAKSEVLAVEADVTLMLAQPELPELMSRLLYLDGTTLADHIPEELYNKTKQLMAHFDMDMANVDRMRPAAIVSEIESRELQLAGYSALHGIDLHFLQRAHEDEKEIAELESIAFQYDMLAGFPDDIQELLLRQAVEGADAAEESLDRLFAIWKAGDSSGLEQMLTETDDGFEPSDLEKAYQKIMLDDRNVGMADKVTQYMSSGHSTLVIVGAAHLVGEKGIVSLLRDQGYVVTQQ